MKKINVSTVRQLSDVEVIFVNSNLISKVIKADIAIDNIICHATGDRCMEPKTAAKMDENGEPVRDEMGCTVEEPILNKDGKPEIGYTPMRIDELELRDIAEKVAPLLRELVEAFEA